MTQDRVALSLQALDGLSIDIPEGSIFGLIGPNGAGKTTCFNCVTGMYRPTAGRVLYRGHDLARLAPHRIARLGIARTFQNVALFGSMTVRDNLCVGAQARHPMSLPLAMLPVRARRATLARIDQAADEALERTGLQAYAQRSVGELSVGIQHRVEIARALAAGPQVLLLDEPAAGLTASEADALGRLIQDVHRSLGLTVLLVEHNMRFVMRTCTSLAVLHFGRKIAQGLPQQVAQDPLVQQAYLGDAA